MGDLHARKPHAPGPRPRPPVLHGHPGHARPYRRAPTCYTPQRDPATVVAAPAVRGTAPPRAACPHRKARRAPLASHRAPARTGPAQRGTHPVSRYGPGSPTPSATPPRWSPPRQCGAQPPPGPRAPIGRPAEPPSPVTAPLPAAAVPRQVLPGSQEPPLTPRKTSRRVVVDRGRLAP